MRLMFLTAKAAAICAFAFAIFLVGIQSTAFGQSTYRVIKVETSTGVEWRCFSGDHHFLSVLALPGGAVAVRPHPGEDPNGWGVTEYIGPMLSSGQPSRGEVISVKAYAAKIVLNALGEVDAGGDSAYGTWIERLTFRYAAPRISGSGAIDVVLPDTLDAVGEDLVIGRMASNYLDDVPRQGTRVGDTGDILKARVSYALLGSPLNFSWIPPLQPGHYPLDESLYISIQNVGRTNNVDTLALGEDFQIAVARKPSLKWTLIADAPMIVGLAYDVSKSQDFAADNVSMSHLVLQGGEPKLTYHFDVRIDAQP